MSISTTKRRNEEVNVGLSNRRKAEITAPKFDLFGETFEFAEIFSATVISSNPTNAQILVKTNDGDEKQISAYGIAVRNSHRIRLYELRKYSNDNSCVVYADALIINSNTGEYKVNLNRKTVIIPAFLTMLFHNASTASFFRVMPVPKWFYILFTLLFGFFHCIFAHCLWDSKMDMCGMSTSICGSHISSQGSEASFVSNGLKEEARDLIINSEILSI